MAQEEEKELKPEEELMMDLAEPLIPLAESKARFLGIFGGRGGTKSWFAADLILAKMVENTNLSVACLREIKGSLDESCKRLLEIRIRNHKLEDYFEVTSTQIRMRPERGSGVIFFKGLSKLTAEGIKSMESIGLAWLEEAQKISQHAIDTLLPTIRLPGSQILATWNPIDKNVPIDKLLRGDKRVKNACVIETNYWDNPVLSDELREQMEHDKQNNPEKYNWIWCGKYLEHSAAKVFSNWKVQAFEAPPGVELRFGVDWGYWPDPTVLVRGYVQGRKIYIEYEAYKHRLLVRNTTALFLTIPEVENYQIRCANDRPERIADIRADQLDAISVRREPNSVHEGFEFLQGFQIIVHPRCTHTQEELQLFSRKVDPLTGEVLTEFEDKNNHCLDAIRAMVDDVRRIERAKKIAEQDKALVADASLDAYWDSGRR